MSFTISVNAQEIAAKLGRLEKEIKKDLEDGIQNLATMTHAKLLELASTDLKSLSKLYMDNVEFTNPSKGLWVVTLKADAMWVEENRKSGFMSELLTVESPESTGKIKQGKNGKYRIIPFKHNKNPSTQSPKAQALADQIRSVIKEKGISWKKIETDQDGSPKLGLLHKFDVDSAKLKPNHATEPLKNVSVYQRKNKVTGEVEKHIVTFRVISEASEAKGLWQHPGRVGSKLMDKAYKWSVDEWESTILPAIFEKYK